MKKIFALILPLMTVAFLAGCGGKPAEEEYDVTISSSDIGSIIITNAKAKKGADFSSVIYVDTSKTSKVFPEQLNKVTSGGNEIPSSVYNYSRKDDRISAEIKIPAGAIAGNINIDLALIIPIDIYSVSFVTPASGLTISKDKIEKGHDLNAVIKIDNTKTMYKLPKNIEKVTSGNVDVTTEFKYQPRGDFEADVQLNRANISGDIKIDIKLIAPEPTPTEFNVIIPQIANLTIDKSKAKKGEEFNATLKVDSNKEEKTLPEKLTSIKIGENELHSSHYTYTRSENHYEAKLIIPMNYVTDAIHIHLSLQDPWYADESYLSGLTIDDARIGVTQMLKVNGIFHRVRLIGIDHDTLSNDTSKKAHTTWEFSNLLSDSDGHSLGMIWDWEDPEKYYNGNFINSTMRKALDGGGSASKRTYQWYNRGSQTANKDYANKRVVDMLPNTLSAKLKKVKKQVAVNETGNSFTIKDYDTSLFILSVHEITSHSSQKALLTLNEGTRYEYYGQHEGDINFGNRFRSHVQVKDNKNVYTSDVKITDGLSEYDRNYAGYNQFEKFGAENVFGGLSWLRSPVASTSNYDAVMITLAGRLEHIGHRADQYAYGIAPAFCL